MNNASQIPQLMERLVQVMTEKGLSAPKYLNPGLSSQEISDLTKGIIELPEDVISFYQYANGMTIDDTSKLNGEQIEIVYGFIFLPLGEVIVEREKLIEHMQEDDQEWIEDSGENIEGWLPILADYSYCLLVDTNRSLRNEPCIFHMMEAFVPYIRYASLESMLRTIVVCYEQNVYTFVDGEFVDFDDAKENMITQMYNPGVDMWM